jgi:predicted amidohydrolase
MKVASINFALNIIGSEDQFFDHVSNLVTEASHKGATLVVLPEYTVAELYSVVGFYEEVDAARVLTKYADKYVSVIESLAKKLSITLVGGSFFKLEDNKVFNICPIAYPWDPTVFQYKNCLVTYERSVQSVSAGSFLTAPDSSGIGTLICYDCEFPVATSLLCNNGMKVLCVPSSTETIHGFRRVRHSCIARAIENQIFVIHAALVGSIDKEPHPVSYGSSAIIAPCAPQFANGPILSESLLNQESIAIADLDFNALEDLRENGEVTNYKDTRSKQWRVITAA